MGKMFLTALALVALTGAAQAHISLNALNFNALVANGARIVAPAAQGAAVSNLNGVVVESVALPTELAR